MLQKRNILALAVASVTLLAGLATLRADNHPTARLVTASKPVAAKNVSLALNGDCNQTAPAPAPQCKTYKPCIDYRGCWDRCGPKVSTVLKVKDPCDCCCNPCLAEIPVCLPACCKNPCVSCKCGLFGRSVVTYSYDCGCCITIVFRNCGDVIVKYSS